MVVVGAAGLLWGGCGRLWGDACGGLGEDEGPAYEDVVEVEAEFEVGV